MHVNPRTTKTITLNIAFPMSLDSTDSSILVKDDFLDCNSERLLQKIGVQISSQTAVPSIEAQVIFERLAARYLAAHSQIPLKTASESLGHGLSALGKPLHYQHGKLLELAPPPPTHTLGSDVIFN